MKLDWFASGRMSFGLPRHLGCCEGPALAGNASPEWCPIAEIRRAEHGPRPAALAQQGRAESERRHCCPPSPHCPQRIEGLNRRNHGHAPHTGSAHRWAQTHSTPLGGENSLRALASGRHRSGEVQRSGRSSHLWRPEEGLILLPYQWIRRSQGTSSLTPHRDCV